MHVCLSVAFCSSLDMQYRMSGKCVYVLMRGFRLKGKENGTVQGNGQGSDDYCSQTLLQGK